MGYAVGNEDWAPLTWQKNTRLQDPLALPRISAKLLISICRAPPLNMCGGFPRVPPFLPAKTTRVTESSTLSTFDTAASGKLLQLAFISLGDVQALLLAQQLHLLQVRCCESSAR